VGARTLSIPPIKGPQNCSLPRTRVSVRRQGDDKEGGLVGDTKWLLQRRICKAMVLSSCSSGGARGFSTGGHGDGGDIARV